jgi:hypothetical protein
MDAAAEATGKRSGTLWGGKDRYMTQKRANQYKIRDK